MKNHSWGQIPITRERIDELLRFLPLMERPGPDLQPTWDGPHPAYPPAVIDFFRRAGQEWWMDYQYDPATAGDLVASDEAIASASLAEIKTMLTFCVRGERFCDGLWGAMVSKGRIGAILRRLDELKETVR